MKSSRGGRLGFQIHLDLGMGVMVGAVAERDCPPLEWARSPGGAVCGDKRQF